MIIAAAVSDYNTNQEIIKQQNIRAAAMHRCEMLQQYYYESGVDVNPRCDKLVSALTD